MQNFTIESRNTISDSAFEMSGQYFLFCGIEDLKNQIKIGNERKRVMIYCLSLALELKMKGVLFAKYNSQLSFSHDLCEIYSSLIGVIEYKKERDDHDQISIQEEFFLARLPEDKGFLTKLNGLYCCNETDHNHGRNHNYLRYPDLDGDNRGDFINEEFDELIFAGDEFNEELEKLRE